MRGRGRADKRQRAPAGPQGLQAVLLLHHAGGPGPAEAHGPRGDALRRGSQGRQQDHAGRPLRRREYYYNLTIYPSSILLFFLVQCY